MMDMKIIQQTLGCGRATAAKRLFNAGYKPEMRSTANGRKIFYNVTVEQLHALPAEKVPEQVAMSQGRALMALESALRGLSNGHQ